MIKKNDFPEIYFLGSDLMRYETFHFVFTNNINKKITFGALDSSFSMRVTMQKNSASLRTSRVTESGGKSLLRIKFKMQRKYFPSRSTKKRPFSSRVISWRPLNITASIESSYFVSVERLVVNRQPPTFKLITLGNFKREKFNVIFFLLIYYLVKLFFSTFFME